MAEYIVDTSVIMQRFIRDTFTEQTRRLFDRLAAPDSFHMPEFCLVECVNVLWKHVRFHSLPQSKAEFFAQELLSYPFTLVPADESLTRALQIGLAHQLVIYDSIYIALAEKYNYPLITADAKQETVAKTVGVTIKPITDF
jgi:predicted nucleic acid-binding protein